MTRASFAFAALMVLAGCGSAPTPVAMTRVTGLQAVRHNTSTKSAQITAPADVMANLGDHYDKLLKKHDGADAHVGVAVTLVASNDRFKHNRHEAKLDNDDLQALGKAHTFTIGMLNGDVAAGEYEYYLVMRGQVSHVVGSRPSFDSLPDFYVSNHGKNYRVVLK